VRAFIEYVRHGRIDRIAFAIPAGVSWPFPIYELALSAATVTRKPPAQPVEVTVVTSEAAPLELFGRKASDAVGALLEDHGVRVITERHPRRVAPGRLELAPGSEVLMVDRVVAAPRLSGPRIPGLPADADGFLPVDDHGRVAHAPGVFAAGDGAAFPVKQGGLAAQQADAAAEAIAADAGAPINPRPFRPVLRGLLFAVGAQRYLRASITGGQGDHDSTVSEEALWWPPTKIAARYLAPYLTAAHDAPAEAAAPDDRTAVPVELEAARGAADEQVRRRALLLADRNRFRAVDFGARAHRRE
jgi:sulfide:quinone oxidoreductase